MNESLNDCIVERGLTAGGYGRDSLLEFLCIAGERLAMKQFDRHAVIEIDDEHFIFRIA